MLDQKSLQEGLRHAKAFVDLRFSRFVHDMEDCASAETAAKPGLFTRAKNTAKKAGAKAKKAGSAAKKCIKAIFRRG
jgi:hypothetical protein